MFALDQTGRDGVFRVEEVNGAAFLDVLFADFLAFDKDIEGALAPFIAVIRNDEDVGVDRLDGQVERKPFAASPRGTAHDAVG